MVYVTLTQLPFTPDGTSRTPLPLPAGCPSQPNVSVRVDLRGSVATPPAVTVAGGNPARQASAQAATAISLTPKVVTWQTNAGLQLCEVRIVMAPTDGEEPLTLYVRLTGPSGHFDSLDGWSLRQIVLRGQLG